MHQGRRLRSGISGGMSSPFTQKEITGIGIPHIKYAGYWRCSPPPVPRKQIGPSLFPAQSRYNIELIQDILRNSILPGGDDFDRLSEDTLYLSTSSSPTNRWRFSFWSNKVFNLCCNLTLVSVETQHQTPDSHGRFGACRWCTTAVEVVSLAYRKVSIMLMRQPSIQDRKRSGLQLAQF